MKDLTKEQAEILKYLGELKVDFPETEDVSGLSHRLSRMCSLLARSVELLADAKRRYTLAVGEMTELTVGLELSPSLVKNIVLAKTADEQYTLTLAERLNATLVHHIDAIRGAISLAKEEMRRT